MTVALQSGQRLHFPKPIPRIKLAHLCFGYVGHLHRKYSAPGFVCVEAGDIVVDCGGFVGGFSLSASLLASETHVFEPAPENAMCARANLEGRDTVQVHEAGLSDQDGVARLNLSASAVEASFLAPDDGPALSTLDVPIFRLESYFASRTPPDFIKVEAEGLEPEIIRGLGKLRPTKIAVDVSPERDGKSPEAEISALLQSWGYETKRIGNVLFARFGSL